MRPGAGGASVGRGFSSGLAAATRGGGHVEPLLGVLAVNVHALSAAKARDLVEHAGTLRPAVDMVWVSETWLAQNEALHTTLGHVNPMDRWDWHPLARSAQPRGGGVGFFMRQNSSLSLVPLRGLQAPPGCRDLENVMWVKVTSVAAPTLPPTFVGGVYVYPKRQYRAQSGTVNQAATAARDADIASTLRGLKTAVAHFRRHHPAAAVFIVGDTNARISNAGGPNRSSEDHGAINLIGRDLLTMAAEAGLTCINGADMPDQGVQRPAETTFFRTQTGVATMIDQVWANAAGRRRVRGMRVLDQQVYAADHNPILLYSHVPRRPDPAPAQQRPARWLPSRHSAAWESYAEAAHAAVHVLLPRCSGMDIDALDAGLGGAILGAAKRHVLPRRDTSRDNVPRHVLQARTAAARAKQQAERLAREVRRLKRAARALPRPAGRPRPGAPRADVLRRRAAHKKYKRLSSRARQLSGEWEAGVVADMLWHSMRGMRNEKHAWRLIKSFLGDSQRREARAVPLTHAVQPGTAIVDEGSVVEAFRRHWAQKTTATPADSDIYDEAAYADFVRQEATHLQEALQDVMDRDGAVPALNANITVGEVREAMAKVKLHRASGPDGIVGDLLVHSKQRALDSDGNRPPSSVVQGMRVLLQKVLEDGQMPASWKVGHVTPVYKGKGDKRDPSNYRPIAIVNVFAKVLGHVINSRLERHVESNDPPLLSHGQCGFRKKRCLEDAVFMVTETARVRMADTSGRTGARYTYVAFLDIKGAFDTVCHEALLVELWRLRVRGRLWLLIRAWLRGTTRRVKIGKSTSQDYHPSCGVPQGEVASPLLYELFEDMLAKHVAVRMTEEGDALGLPGRGSAGRTLAQHVHMAYYADDSAALATSRPQLQFLLSCLAQKARQLRFQFAPAKSKVMIFRPTRNAETVARLEHPPGVPPLHLGDVAIPVESTSLVYLGVTLTPTLNWRPMQTRVLKPLPAMVPRLLSIQTSRAAGNARLMRAVAFAFLGSKLEFGCELWADTTTTAKMTRTAAGHWRRLLASAMGVSRRTPMAVLRGDMGVWRVQARWAAARFCMHFRLALLPPEDWRRMVWDASRAVHIAMAEGGGRAVRERGAYTWHAHINAQLEAFGFPPLARTDPAAYLQGASVLASGVRAFVVEQVQAHEASVWLRVVQGEQVDADVGRPLWQAAVALEGGGAGDAGGGSDGADGDGDSSDRGEDSSGSDGGSGSDSSVDGSGDGDEDSNDGDDGGGVDGSGGDSSGDGSGAGDDADGHGGADAAAPQRSRLLQHTYARLGLTLGSSVAPYLLGRGRRLSRLRARLRCDGYKYLATFRGRVLLDVPFEDRVCFCGVQEESVAHFLLRCVALPGVVAARNALWGAIAGLSAGGDVVATEVAAVVHAARPAVGPWDVDLLLGVILEGNVGDAMPDGYMDTMASPPPDAAVVHRRVTRMCDSFLRSMEPVYLAHFHVRRRAALQRAAGGASGGGARAAVSSDGDSGASQASAAHTPPAPRDRDSGSDFAPGPSSDDAEPVPFAPGGRPRSRSRRSRPRR